MSLYSTSHPFYKVLKGSDGIKDIDLVVDSDPDGGLYYVPLCGTCQAFGGIEVCSIGTQKIMFWIITNMMNSINNS